MSNARVELHQSLSATDLFNFSMVAFLRSKLGRLVFVAYLVGCMLAITAITWSYYANALDSTLILFGISTVVVFPLFYIGVIWYSSRAFHSQQRARFTDMRFELNDEGVLAQAGGREHAYAWDSYKSALETKQHFLLFFGPKAAHILSKSAFRTDREREACRTLLRQKLHIR
jgi:cbb3-type cytochrome oxidase subunit 3